MSEISKNNKEIGKTIATKVPINIHNQLINLIENGDYLSISDFLREAIREQLKTYKVANFREINYFDAKKEVLSYFIRYWFIISLMILFKKEELSRFQMRKCLKKGELINENHITQKTIVVSIRLREND